MMPFRATQTLRTFLARFPDEKSTEQAKHNLELLEQACATLLAKLRTEELFPLDGEEAAQVLRNHEWSQVLVHAGRLDEAIELQQELTRQTPNWSPPLNNLCTVLGLLGRSEEALVILERVLASEPNNVFALGERGKHLFFLGQTEAAQELSAKLLSVAAASTRDDAELKLAELLALLGDDEGVRATYAQAAAANRPQDPALRALLLFFAGTAELRLGDEAAARQRWQESLAAQPGATASRAALAELRLPPGERHIPFYLEGTNLFPAKWKQELLEALHGRQSDETLRARAQRYLSERPTLLTLIPVLLDRGDQAARILALTLCKLAATPQTLATLREFALGQRGPDQLRLDLLPLLGEMGLLPTNPVRMWRAGKWTEVVARTFEIVDEPTNQHSPKVEALASQAHAAMQRGDVLAAEQLLIRALHAEPNAPDLLNNQAAVLGQQGRNDEAQVLLADIRRRFPDYSFGIINEAERFLSRGEPQAALDLVDVLLRRPRLHTSELAGICGVQVRALTKLGDHDGARYWFEMLRSRAPDHSMVPLLRRVLKAPQSHSGADTVDQG
jgi:Tfp pilus assembly protein PilF